MRRLDLVVGPNGAGKSTFVRMTLAKSLPSTVPFVNADEIAAQRWPSNEQEHAYQAAEVAAATRAALIGTGLSFIAETVFSHHSKLELIDAAHVGGYVVFLHVLLVPLDLTVERVAHRVAAGGHPVPETKIRQRYQRLWPLVAAAMTTADAATGYDNSTFAGPRIVAQLAGGTAIGTVGWPDWTPSPLSRRWPNT
ncbi:AAA family ATPase [Jatrophihabitans sp.]|jgi:predicted ABC-type ATPase|uniref:AAA family ATPase n=1 Tax=Jatrophihabitans sp. TaxID=1932789 RepID=UPI002EE2B31A